MTEKEEGGGKKRGFEAERTEGEGDLGAEEGKKEKGIGDRGEGTRDRGLSHIK